MSPAPKTKKSAHPARAPRAADVTPPLADAKGCLLCGSPVTHPTATLCLNCIKKSEKGRRPRFAGGARTEHGTRVARAVTCVRCGKEDHVAFRPRDAEKVMCRACTLEVVGLDEHGDPKAPALLEITCQNCGKKERMPRRRAEKLQDPHNPEPILCQDCEYGIVTQQGDKLRTGERRKSGVILKRRPAG